MKNILSTRLLIILLIISMLTGCLENSLKTSSEKTTLRFYMLGEEEYQGAYADEILEEFYKRTKNKFNVDIEFIWTPSNEYKQKLPMRLAGGENIDLIFDAPWLCLERMAMDGAYIPLDSYMNNDDYPGLKKAFSEDYINNNKFFGKLYALPIANTFMDMEGISYRKDLAEKYGMDDITSFDELYAFLEKIKNNEPDMIPYASYGTDGFFKVFLEFSKRELDGKVFTFPDPYMGYIDIALSADGKSVSGAALYGDDETAYSGFNPLYGRQYVLDYFDNCHKFSQFLTSNVLASGAGIDKEVGAVYTTLSNFSETSSSNPDIKLGFFPIYENSRNMTTHGQATDFKAWNYICIPSSSKNADLTMKVLDWIFASQENNDLFTYGIEGKHWKAVGDDQYKKLVQENGLEYGFPAYQLSWNPSYHRINADFSEKIKDYFEYEFNDDTFTKTDLAGFSFDQNPVKTELAKCAPIIEKYMPVLRCGLDSNPESLLKQFNSEIRAVGADKIKNELVKQINEFLANNNK